MAGYLGLGGRGYCIALFCADADMECVCVPRR